MARLTIALAAFVALACLAAQVHAQASACENVAPNFSPM